MLDAAATRSFFSLLCFSASGCGTSNDTEPAFMAPVMSAGGTSMQAGAPGVTAQAGMQSVGNGIGGASASTGGIASMPTPNAGQPAVGTGGGSVGGTPAAAGAAAGGGAPSGGASSMMAGSSSGGAPAAAADEMPLFSFFTTSQDGLLRLRYGDAIPADLSTAGFGGNLGGLEGADAMCAALAKEGNPTDNKVWRAFLSATAGGENDGPVNAIDRIGDGPWYNFNGAVFAMDRAGLMQMNGRPAGADPELAAMFTDEHGEPVSFDTQQVDNHDVLTGSDEEGLLLGGFDDTCRDWTYAEDPGFDVSLRIGHAWPRSDNNGRNWISEHDVRGCLPGVHVSGGGGAAQGDRRAGAGGGYGGFYCFAILD